MRHKRILFLLVAAALALPIGIIAPAGAAPVNACTTSEYGALPSGQSELKVACTLTTASATAGQYNKVEDFSSGAGATGRAEAVWHVGAARTVVTTAATVAPSAVVTAAAGHFTTADINVGISGPGVPARAFIKTINSATQVTLNIPTTGAGIASGASLLVENSDGRSFADAAFPAGTTITSASGHFCKSGLAGCGTKTDIGRNIHGTRLQHGTTITAVASVTSATLSLAPIACPAGVGTCGTVDTAPAPTTTTHRYVDDVTVNGTSLCSAQARFGATDLN